MRGFAVAQIIGMALLIAGGQGLIRLVVDTDNRGFLGWLPGGAASVGGGYAVLVVAGIALAAWAQRRRHATD